jgi:hypothetical protein
MFNKKTRNPPPTFDPDVSLGDVSMIDGIYDDAARAGAYLDSQQTGTSNITPDPLSVVDGNDLDLKDLKASSTSQTESTALLKEVSRTDTAAAAPSMVDASIQTAIPAQISCDSLESPSAMIDATVQTEIGTIVKCDAGVQVNQMSESRPECESVLTLQLHR